MTNSNNVNDDNHYYKEKVRRKDSFYIQFSGLKFRSASKEKKVHFLYIKIHWTFTIT